jgi:hypothetical protein
MRAGCIVSRVEKRDAMEGMKEDLRTVSGWLKGSCRASTVLLGMGRKGWLYFQAWP